jgi:hypothetical protein
MPKSFPAALPVATVVLRTLIVLNWIYGAGVLAILIGMLAAGPWTMTALGVPPSAETEPLIRGMRMIAVLGLAGVPLNYLVLTRLFALVDTVRAGDPFVATNAVRLNAIAWAVLAQQVLQLIIGLIAKSVSTPAHPLPIEAFSTGGALAVILLFVLARVFAEGACLRDDLEGTV